MLYLTRKVGEAVIINHDVEVRVVELRGKTVKLGFTFPARASVLREEVFLELEAANRAAAEGDVDAVAGSGEPARDPEDDR